MIVFKMNYLKNGVSKIIWRKNINNSQKELNLIEIDNKIQNLFERCRSKGISNEEISKMGYRILKRSIEGSNKKIYKYIIKFLSLIVLIIGIVSIERVNRLACMYGRLMLFEIEPYWNWKSWYSSSCLIDNPFYNSNRFSERDCFPCEDIVSIERRNDLNPDIMAEKFIRNEIPVIIDSIEVKNELKKWSIANESFNLEDLEKVYEEDDWKHVCMFQTNIKTNDHLTLLKKMRTNKYSEIGWYAHWENCDKKTEKQLRRYYNRLTILPSMLELTKSNWIIVSSNYNGKNFKKIDPSPGTQLMLMIQLRGQNDIKLEPKELCVSRGCSTINETLYKNDLLLFSTKLWQLYYSPISDENLAFNSNSNLNLALLIGAIYD